MSIHYRRSPITEEREKRIRRRVFHDKVPPRQVMAEEGIARATFYRICGGPIGGPNSIEKAYGS